MKLLKYIFFLVLILIIGISFFIATLDGNYDISKSRIIKVPIEVVFNEVNDFKSWEKWGPWYELDSTIIASFPEKTSGIGASYTWTGTDGIGSMETLSLIPNKEIIQQIDFGTGTKPEVYWKFNTIDDTTEVIWGMRGKSEFAEKAYWLTQGGIEKNMEPMYERGLELLEQYLLKELEKHTIETKGIVDYGGGYYLYLTTSCKVEEQHKKMDKMLFVIKDYMAENEIETNGKPFTLTHKWDEVNNTTMFSACIPVKERIVLTGDVLIGFLAPQKTFKTILRGDSKFSLKAWEVAFKTLKEKGLTEKNEGEPFEVYTINSNDISNPSKWVTEIYIPIN
jgi:effector-binding domain-containing protein